MNTSLSGQKLRVAFDRYKKGGGNFLLLLVFNYSIDINKHMRLKAKDNINNYKIT